MGNKGYYLTVGGEKVEVSEEVYLEYRRGEDKERYFMKTLKKGRISLNQETQETEFIPAREQSYDSLADGGMEPGAPGEPAEAEAVRNMLVEELEEALQCLTDGEMALIQELFYMGKTEREACASLGMAKTTLHRRKEAALQKLRKKMGNI